MRSITLLLLASVLAVPAAAQKDGKDAKNAEFKNVEYQSGLASLTDKQKGTLVVSATEVQLVDKHDKPYLAIPIADIHEVKDSSYEVRKAEKKSSSSVTGIPKLSGLFGKSKPDGALTILTEKDSVKNAIVFEVKEKGDLERVASAIRTQLRKAKADTAGAAAQQAAAPAVQLLVTNPFSAAPEDSATAVEVGNAVRVELKKFVGDKLDVVTREQMNAALDKFGYPADAVLNHDLSVMLAKTLGVPYIMTGEMKKGTDGRYTVVSSLGAVSDTTAKAVTVEQQAGESLADFGRRIAESIK